MASRIEEYTPPDWAANLDYVPKFKAKLAMTPTPLHEWRLPGTPDEFKVCIKRDDMTGSALTGNKIRKLDFILAEAKDQGCKHIITMGGLGSNHCRATAAACVELGLTPHLFLLSPVEDVTKVKFDGNMLINKLVGAHMYLVAKDFDYEGVFVPLMNEHAAKLERESGEKARIVPVGGSDLTGLFGYFECFEEIRQQGVEFDDLVCVCGSGGMMSGLAIANYLNGSPYKIHAVNIGDMPDKFARTESKMKALGITEVKATDIVTVYEEYKGLYGQSQPAELELIAQTAAETGIILDTVFTAKAAYGMRDLMRNRPEVFKGRRVLFIHSGGLTGVHSSQVTDLILPYSTASQISSCTPL